MVAWGVLLALHRWLSYLNRHVGRWSTSCLPSCPLLVGADVLCVWMTFAEPPPAPPSSAHFWSYAPDADGNLRLSAVALVPAPLPVVQAWLITTPCSRCGRPEAVSGVVAESGGAAAAWSSPPGECCWYVGPETSLTSELASRSSASFCGGPLRGVLPGGRPALARPGGRGFGWSPGGVLGSLGVPHPPPPPPPPWARVPPPLAWRGACRRRLLASCAG